MLYVNAYEETNYDPESGYINFPYSVGKFIIPDAIPPFNIQQQILAVAGDKPVIMAKSNRVRVSTPEGQEPQFEFVFDHWYQLIQIEVVTEEFAR